MLQFLNFVKKWNDKNGITMTANTVMCYRRTVTALLYYHDSAAVLP